MATLFVDKVDPQSGTSLEIGSSGDTITIPSGATITNNGTQTGFGGVNTPAFHAYLSSAQSIPDTTQTLIQFDTEAFDSAGAYDTSTYKFTPQVAGKYVVYAQMTPNSGDDYDTFELQMYKNEVSTAGTQALCRGRNEASDTKYINRIVEFNGSTDFVYMYTYQDSSASRNIRGTKYDTFFGAYKIIE